MVRNTEFQILAVSPQPKPTMTRQGRFSRRATEYFRYVETLRVAFDGTKDIDPTLPLEIVFCIPMPDSWTEKKRKCYLGQPCLQKPDLDNLQKAFNDGVLVKHDEVVFQGVYAKVWVPWPGFILIRQIEETIYSAVVRAAIEQQQQQVQNAD